jgi:F-type H+-transporting ATPase subunit b
MNINATIFGQMITFGIFVWINIKFIWPKVIGVITDRENKILAGLQAAETSHQKLLSSESFIKTEEAKAKKHCALLIAEAEKQAEEIIEAAVISAKQKEVEIIEAAHLDLQKEQLRLKHELKEKLADLIVFGAEKVLKAEINPQHHQQILSDISNSIYEQH